MKLTQKNIMSSRRQQRYCASHCIMILKNNYNLYLDGRASGKDPVSYKTHFDNPSSDLERSGLTHETGQLNEKPVCLMFTTE